MKPNSILLLLAGLGLLAGCSPAGNQYAEPPPPEVTVAFPVVSDIYLFVDEDGSTEPKAEAEIRSRVQGFVEEVYFDPGQLVTAGDLLYEIEKDQYRADRDSAAALLASAEAAISVAKANEVKAQAEVLRTERDFSRQEQLLQSKAISPADYDQALSARDTAAANLKAVTASIGAAEAEKEKANASLAQAELNLGYTTIDVPISGWITKTAIKEGNLVDVGTPLAKVVDDSDLYINFSISDRLLLRLKRAYEGERSQAPESGQASWRGRPVFIRSELEDSKWLEAKLDYIDQEGVDADTGTFALRAVFDNRERRLLPGLFVEVRLPIQEVRDAVVIPLKAVQRSQLGDAVLVVGAGNVVERRPVRLGDQLDNWVTVEEGLSPKELIIIEGLMKAIPKETVNPGEPQPLDTKELELFQRGTESREETTQ